MRGPASFFPSVLLGVLLVVSSSAGGPADEDCLACHGDRDLKTEGGRSLFVSSEAAADSVHGRLGLECVDCHAGLKRVEGFPHAAKVPPVDCGSCHAGPAAAMSKSVHSPGAAGSAAGVPSCADCHGRHDIKPPSDIGSRVFPLNLPRTCEQCHASRVPARRGAEFVKKYESSVHYLALAKAGLTLAANCSNCHGSHDVRAVRDPASPVARPNIIATCGHCHAGIERDYLQGVHGRDYLKGIKDVPVCTDCHSEHDIRQPQDAESTVYPTRVAQVCSRCHDDEALSRRYGFVTSRLKSYYNSFHGTASRFGETRVANCASCHGFHNIRPSDDPQSSVNPANLSRTCGRCHAGASRNFSRGKIHVVSQKDSSPGAHLVKTFYIILISSVIGVALMFIAVDLMHRIRFPWKK
jgi:hypothetical protein